MLQPTLHLGRFAWQRLVLASVLALFSLGCGAELSGRTVSDVTLHETSPSALDTDEALAGLATAAPSQLLWIDRDPKVYDANLVGRDLERIERYYRARGYYDVKVVAARVTNVGEHKVRIEVDVTPGPRVSLRSNAYDPPLSQLPLDASNVAYNKSTLKMGQPFQESELDKQKQSIEDALKEAGYPFVKVQVRAKVDLNSRSADAVTNVKLGPRGHYGEIRIGGLKQIPESKVRAALGLKRGRPYVHSELEDARAALSDLHVFSSVDIAADASHPDQAEVPIIVTVQEDKLRLLTLGGGTQLDSLKWDAHLRSDWEHRNFLGGARHFQVEAQGGFYFFPTRFEDFSTLVRPSDEFFVLKTKASLEQPSIFNGRTSGNTSLAFSRQPVLYSLPEGANPDNERVIGYYEPSGRVGLRRTYWGSRIEIEPSYNLKARIPFWLKNPPNCSGNAVVPEAGCGLETVWVSYPKLVFSVRSRSGDIIKSDRDARDLRLSFRNSIELAGLSVGGTRYLGGSVSDLKIEPEVTVFAPISGKRWQDGQTAPNFALALRAAVGFILLPDYGNTLDTGRPTQAMLSDQDTLSDQQKLLTRAFYSGGPSSNRGYALRAISPHGPIGFLQPTRINCALEANVNNSSCIRPLGGFTLWEASAELRFAGLYPFTIVAFADVSDVSRDIGSIGFQYPHLSVGPGVRYESPVGPLRLDFGIRVPGWQAVGQDELPREHGQERPNLGDIPGAVVLAFGDAF